MSKNKAKTAICFVIRGFPSRIESSCMFSEKFYLLRISYYGGIGYTSYLPLSPPKQVKLLLTFKIVVHNLLGKQGKVQDFKKVGVNTN